jgi:hypothetical protein
MHLQYDMKCNLVKIEQLKKVFKAQSKQGTTQFQTVGQLLLETGGVRCNVAKGAEKCCNLLLKLTATGLFIAKAEADLQMLPHHCRSPNYFCCSRDASNWFAA